MRTIEKKRVRGGSGRIFSKFKSIPLRLWCCREKALVSCDRFSQARSIVKLVVLRRPKHRREAAQNMIIVEVCIHGDTDCTQAVSSKTNFALG